MRSANVSAFAQLRPTLWLRFSRPGVFSNGEWYEGSADASFSDFDFALIFVFSSYMIGAQVWEGGQLDCEFFGAGQNRPGSGRGGGRVGPWREPARPLASIALPRAQIGRAIAAFLPWIERGGRLYCLDGGNAFNPYRLAALARQRGLVPEVVLGRVLVSRAYTCHQLLGSVEQLLRPLAAGQEARPVGGRAIGGRATQGRDAVPAEADNMPGPTPGLAPGPSPVLLLGVDRLFHDEDLPLWERRYLFGRILDEATELRRRGLPILLTWSGRDTPEARPWAQLLRSKTRMLGDTATALARIEKGLGHGADPADVQHLP